jgi:quercetin dioxygenase-like cupin family protein
MKPLRLRDASEFRPEKFLPRLLYGSPRARAFLLSLEPGQGLPPRPDSEEAICLLIEGTARLTVGAEVFDAAAGDFAAAAAGDIRGIEARERCVALWVHLSERDEVDG